MSESPLLPPAAIAHPPQQEDLPGIPRGSTLAEILAGYGLKLSEAPGGIRQFRHELVCNGLEAIAEILLTPTGDVEAFRVWSRRPRKPRGQTTATS